MTQKSRPPLRDIKSLPKDYNLNLEKITKEWQRINQGQLTISYMVYELTKSGAIDPNFFDG